MNTLLVLGLIALTVVAVALMLRRGAGDAQGYRRRFAPRAVFRRSERPPADRSAFIWTPLVMADPGSHSGVDPGCTSPGHPVDCGGSAGADGGTS